jgi:hypothetical protein
LEEREEGVGEAALKSTFNRKGVEVRREGINSREKGETL